MAGMTGANNIVDLTRSLIDLLQTSTRRGGDFVTIAEELNHVKSYINIQALCGAWDFSFSCRAENGVEELLTPRCILQPVVENALIHGLDNREGDNEIAVSVYRKDAVVYMEVFDNGNGMTEEKTSALLTREGYGDRRYSSIGLRNIDERIKLCFGGEYGVSFDSKVNQYTRVILRIPVTTRSGGEEEEVDNDGA
jgi:two-component system sensor histidine kinase YesM